jgi:2-(1,2-epoxy-1,2-dihydrophenyl)acetyl-CoA isomerase
MNDLVQVEALGDISVVTLNNPKTRNALSRDLLLLLADALEALRTDTSCRAVVLTGADGHFCSGGDVSGMAAERPLPVGRERMVIAHRVVRLIVEMGKPVVAAVEGYAAGAGFSLAMAADCVVASGSAKFVSSFAKVSLLPDLGLMWTLPQRVGLAQAKRLLMSARVVAAEEALRLGVADELCEAGQAVQRAREVAAELAAHAPISVALLKAAYARGINTLGDALAYEMDNQAALYLTQDHREAVSAFMEKRPPVFRGV